MKNINERHQFGFGFMRLDTGGERVKSFWGNGSVEEAKTDARNKALAYLASYENELNEKARMKSRMRGDMYAPSHIDVRLNGCSLWK